jgi:transketolase
LRDVKSPGREGYYIPLFLYKLKMEDATMQDTRRKDLESFAARIRIETIKELKSIGSGHIGGAMSMVEALAVLYGEVMNIDPQNPTWKDRDWLVLSKGHTGPSLYATLALKGFFPVEELETLNRPGTALPSHCDRNKTKGIDMTTGSLGQGVSTAIGVAYGNRLNKRDNYTYLIIGDGECQEGQVWEGAMFAAHHKVDHLIAFVDSNKKQLDGYLEDINDLGNIAEKFACFGWNTQEVDGTDVIAIYEAINKAKENKGKPSVIVLNTTKGHGCSFAECAAMNHHMVITPEMAEEAIAVLEDKLAGLNLA